MQETQDTRADRPASPRERHAEIGQAAHPAEESLELDPADFEPRPFQLPRRRSTVSVAVVLVLLLLAVTLPPLLNVSRFQRQIATSISRSLGRTVHMDSVTLNLLPMPGFTLHNFVVGEDPAFGSEPVIHANSVRARLRVRSLWRRRVEFSRISLTDTSVNLVHRADGRWNIESILLQAAKIDAAPTQAAAGYTPRFPYVEATNARVNVKMGLEKMPLALTEADFALWLPDPAQWRLRLLAHPSRTDNAATDTGILRLQGTLGRAATLANVPVDLAAEWTSAPLGAVSWIVLGRDAGFRGDLSLRSTVSGTTGSNTFTTRLQLRGARRADFVPARPLDLDVVCQSVASGIFHHLDDLRCVAPAEAGGNGSVLITGEIPDLFHPRTALLEARTGDLPAEQLLDALRLASPRISPALHLGGTLSGSASPNPPQGHLAIANATLALADLPPFLHADIPAELAPAPTDAPGGFSPLLSFGPIPLLLGGTATLEGHADSAGYTLHLTGSMLRSRLLALATALPQFGDGLADALPPLATPALPEAPIRLDLISTHPWGGGQSWTPAPSISPRHSARPRPARRR